MEITTIIVSYVISMSLFVCLFISHVYLCADRTRILFLLSTCQNRDATIRECGQFAPFRRRMVRIRNMAEGTTLLNSDDDRETGRPRFGTRNLSLDGDVFQHNAWYVLRLHVYISGRT